MNGNYFHCTNLLFKTSMVECTNNNLKSVSSLATKSLKITVFIRQIFNDEALLHWQSLVIFQNDKKYPRFIWKRLHGTPYN